MNERNGELTAIRNAVMFGASGENLTIVEIQGLYDYIAAHESTAKTGEPHRCFISGIQYAGNAAMPEVIEESLFGNDYTNYLQLLKTDGKWVIVNKAYNATPSVK